MVGTRWVLKGEWGQWQSTLCHRRDVLGQLRLSSNEGSPALGPTVKRVAAPPPTPVGTLHSSCLPSSFGTRLKVSPTFPIWERVRVLVAQCLTLVTAWTAAHQASLFMGFPRQEYWSGLPFLSLGDLPNLGIDPGLLPGRQILYHLSHKGNSNLRVLSISWYISESHTCNQMHRRKNILVTVIF